ncbi:hypothetical protein BGZ61DRAFT_585583 [Ilyonectria robusta]|uniref:uncharacterized protein n=1 Tax=Ilyonectria robusta TaxID=1079257 RepID=UPI001E8C9E55|nr:uncharacterized protein BGZ61DRAFT_585583 [Ilyonectria robusta]KAH8733822.1 hypothetical protein BGZ61DRAFT_585583 [Ilyonectria robusta]
MHNGRSHPLLEQVPLTVSPFVSLPAATTLSYTYRSMPSALPPSALDIAPISDDPAGQPKPKYVISSTGHAAHPDDIIASCRALQAHVSKMQEDADRELRELEERFKSRDLAEKRRVAPGWLDSESRLLEPERNTPAQSQGIGSVPEAQPAQSERSEPTTDDQGAALDRAFGGMALR